MAPIRILIADDHQIVAQALSDVLGHEPDLDVVGIALDGDDAYPLRDAYVKNLATNEMVVASRVDWAGGKVANAGAAASHAATTATARSAATTASRTGTVHASNRRCAA